ncbi:MAG: WG repeat-containing protein [Bacteroidetes bacterium]|nr:WG repeat-containing protein [Bacteroidota bacterium]
MKFRFYASLSLLLSLSSVSVFSQQEIIDRVFSNKPVDYRSQLVIEDTLAAGYFYNSSQDGYSYSSTFGLPDFQNFLSYRNKLTGKVGFIVLGTSVSGYSDAIADSIYFLQTKDVESSEGYDDMGNYVMSSHAKVVQFYFEMAQGADEYWTVTEGSANYSVQKSGTIEKDFFKAVAFTEVITPEGYSTVKAVYANIGTNRVYKSAVLDERVTINEVYAYHYDYYGEYDYYYSYEMPETDYSVPYFETQMNYAPIEISYTLSGDTIGDVLSYSYPEADPNAYYHKAIPDEFSGVWKAENDTMIIVDGDDMWSAYGVFLATIDSYKGLYEASKVSLSEALSKMNLSADDQKKVEAGWKGSKTDIRLLSLSSWAVVARYKDIYLANDQVMAHIYFEGDMDGNRITGVEFLTPEKVYENFGFAYYDSYNYTTNVKDLNGDPVDLYNAGVAYYYNYNLSVADRNIDKEGNLVLTTESLGSLTFKAYSGGSNYVGKVRYQWIGSSDFDENAIIVGVKSMPYKIVDESGKVMADDIFSMYVTNVQGFNLYQIYNSQNKVGVMGPDGNWMVKQEWDAVSVLGPSSSYGYDGYGTIGLPVFFSVMNGDKYGALDSKGNWIVPMGYDYIEVCSGQILASRSGKISVFSFDGKMLIDQLDGFGGGYYYGYATDCYSFDYTATGSRILIKDSKYGIVDKNFTITVPFKYSNITPVTGSNKYIVADENGKYGMINDKNEEVLAFEYDLMIPFDYYPNRLVASKDGKQGVINENGEVLIPFEYYSISTGSDWMSNMIYISDPDYRTNIIDTTGKSIIDAGCSYVYYYPTQEIFYCSGYDGQFTFYDKNGTQLYSKIATYIDPYSAYDYVQISQVGDYEQPLFGAFDLTSGADLMPYEFESLYPFWINDQVFFAGTKKGKLGIYSIDGTTLVKPKGLYLDNYYYETGEYGPEEGYYVEISNKKGKSKLIRLNW